MSTDPHAPKERKRICENRYFSVYFDSLEQNDQPTVTNYLVIEPKSTDEEGVFGACILPVSEGKIGLLRVYRYLVGRHNWELPGGFVEKGESVRITALRELEEETGLCCNMVDLRDLGTIAPVPGMLAGKVRIFIANACRPSEQARIPEIGHGEFRWFSESEVEDLIAKGEINDAVVLIAWYRRKSCD